MKKIIIKFEEDGELDLLVNCDETAPASSFLVPWKWLGDSQDHESDDDDDDAYNDEPRYNMIGDCYGRITGRLLHGKIHGTVFLWHCCFNHGTCHHKISSDGILVWDGGKTRRNNWVCAMEFAAGKMIGKPKIHPVVIKRYHCQRAQRVFFSSLPMGNNSLKCCAEWWAGEGYVPTIIEWS